MGMWMLAAAAAAKRKQDQRKAAARRERRRRDEERRAKEKNGYSRSSSGKLPSFYACVEHELREDTELREFFQELYKKMHEVRNEATKDYPVKAEKFVEIADKYRAERQRIQEELIKLGVKFEGYDNLGSISVKQFSSEDNHNPSFSVLNRNRGNGIWGHSDRKHYERRASINGLETKYISESLVMEEYPETKLNIATEELRINKEKRANLKKEYDKLAKRRLFVNEDKKTHRLKVLSNQMSELDNTIGQNELAIKLHTFAAGLTDDQKKELVKYLRAEEGIRGACNGAMSLLSNFGRALPKFKDEKVMFAALQLMENEGLTEERITSIFRTLDKIAIRRERGEYSSSLSKDNYEDSEILKLFIKKVYEADPEFVDRNLAEIVEPEKVSLDKEKQNISNGEGDPEL